MKIAIRMDDITPDMDWQRFMRFKALLDQYQVKPLIGLVPDNQDENLSRTEKHEDFWEYVKGLQRDGWVLAMHGGDHIYRTKKMGLFPLNQLSEYAGLSYKAQLEDLSRGQSILKEQGIETELFMAPAHSFDKNTLKALKKLGFTKLTDGFGNMPYEYKDMTFYPISFKQSSSLKKEKGYTTFVVHTNTMNDKDFERYETLFQEHRHHMINYSEFMNVPAKRRGLLGHLKEKLMAYMKFLLVQKL